MIALLYDLSKGVFAYLSLEATGQIKTSLPPYMESRLPVE